jgi:hypothetical protein
LKVKLANLARSHLAYCLNNPELFTNSNFSTIQYSNVDILKNHRDTSRDIYNALARCPRHFTYLNLGTGIGFLERFIKDFGNVNLDSVEWEDQYFQFEDIRKFCEIVPTYKCNDINEDNFKIFDCNKKYDYILLIRFYPLNKKNNSLKQVKNILNKLKQYSDKVIILDDLHTNYNKEVIDYFNSIAYKKLSLDYYYDYVILNLE